jgi:hypothetical protein
MKTLGISLFIIALAAVAPAQTSAVSSQTTDLQVLQVNWKIGYRMTPPDGRYESATPAREVRSGQRAISNPGERIPEYSYAPISNPTVQTVQFSSVRQYRGYLYQAKVRHTGAKRIAAVEWEYVFTDPLEGKVVARHTFYTKIKISPGTEKRLTAFNSLPPTRIINAKAVENNPEQPFTEQVIIKRIEYADGSSWELPSK